MQVDLSGKIALVSGGTHGIGKTVAEFYCDAGAEVIILGRSADSVVSEESKCGKMHYFKCDVSKKECVQQVFQEISREYERIDIVANVAGISPKAENGMKIRCHEQTIEQWEEVIDTNLNSMFYICKMVIPGMMSNKYGRIINMSSIVGLTSSEHGPASAAYVTSKTGVVGLTRALAYDLAPYGITVNAVAPGRISTKMSAANNEYYNKLHNDLIPMHRFGTVEDVANVFLFLAGEESNYITGETINITGGWFI